MNYKFNIKPFVELGQRLRDDLITGSNSDVIARSCSENEWFTPQSVLYSLKAICDNMLSEDVLTKWLACYEQYNIPSPKRVGVVMAGNIPAVGFFDMLCVLVCGHECLIKPSSKDRILIDYIVGILRDIDTSVKIGDLREDSVLDAVIATGGDVASMAFKSRYGVLPSIIRSDRTSVAVLTGTETVEELQGLAVDMFTYFGLGCRNVSHLFLPRGYDIVRLVSILSRYDMDNIHFLNDCRQHKAVLVMQGKGFYDGGFFVITQNNEPSNRLSEITYRYYDEIDELNECFREQEAKIQCVVSSQQLHVRSVNFSEAQKPKLWDYPDGVDVVEFLLYLKQ